MHLFLKKKQNKARNNKKKVKNHYKLFKTNRKDKLMEETLREREKVNGNRNFNNFRLSFNS